MRKSRLHQIFESHTFVTHLCFNELVVTKEVFNTVLNAFSDKNSVILGQFPNRFFF